MIVTVSHIKGGVGKSSTALPLAALLSNQGKDVLLIDADKQRTVAKAVLRRAEVFEERGQRDPHPWTTVELTGKSIKDEIKRLAPKYDHVIVDVGGRDTDTLRSALLAADVALIPVLPRTWDVWTTIEDLADLINQSRIYNEALQPYTFLNMADPTSVDNSEAIQILEQSDVFGYLDAVMVRRKSIPNNLADGMAVFEAKNPDSKAVAELRWLGHQVFTELANIK